MIEKVSYTQLKSDDFKSYHSGDITHAPKGACEFIDITIDPAIKLGARYLAMNVMVYCGPNFNEHEVCYAGWMTRTHPNSNEIFDPKTVEQKIDVQSQCRNVLPVVFDLVERKAIWVDMKTRSNQGRGGNNVESNRATIQQKVKAIVSSDNKLSLYELFQLHVAGRGELVQNKEEAQTVFSLYQGTGPFDVNEINADYLM
jgi:hypothetical protein